MPGTVVSSPFLVYRDGGGDQQLVPLESQRERLTVGRGQQTDLWLEWDAEASRLHAAFERLGGDWTVVDDGLSRNGTYVNGERVNGRRRLEDGDRIVFGETPVTFRSPAGAEAESTAAVRVGASDVPLSESQRKVLIALCRPLKDSAYATPATNKDIADEIHLSVDAVKAHLRVLFERFGLDDLPQNQKRARLAAVALVNGVVKQHEF